MILTKQYQKILATVLLFVPAVCSRTVFELESMARVVKEHNLDYAPGEMLIRLSNEPVCSEAAQKSDNNFRLFSQELSETKNLFPAGSYLERVFQQTVRLEEAKGAECLYRVVFARAEELVQIRNLAVENLFFRRVSARLLEKSVFASRNSVTFLEVQPALQQAEPIDQYHLSDLRLPEFWQKIGQGSGATIVVMDTGVEPTHPDLFANFKPELSAFFIGIDGSDRIGHGTFIAGLAGGSGPRIFGVAPKGRIVSLKIMERVFRAGQFINLATTDSILGGYYYLLNNHDQIAPSESVIIVVNAFGFWEDQPEILAALQAGQKIFLTAAAAGNDSSTQLNYPCRYAAKTANVLCVTSVSGQLVLSSFANIGPELDLAMFGENLISSHLNGGYARGSGTSFSAALSAGLAGLAEAEARSRNRKVTPQQLRGALIRSSFADTPLTLFFSLRIQNNALLAWRELQRGILPPRARTRP